MGDKVGRDKYTVSDISGTGHAIGPGAQSHVSQGLSTAELDRLFAPLVTLAHDLPPEKRAPAEQQVNELKQEAAKGKSADDGRLAKLIDGLVDLVPAAVGTVVSMFATPILGGIAGPVTKFLRGEASVRRYAGRALPGKERPSLVSFWRWHSVSRSWIYRLVPLTIELRKRTHAVFGGICAR